MKKKEILLVFLIILLAALLRLYKIDRPIADWHSWRQADTAAVARNFVKEDFNVLYPKSDSFLLTNEVGRANPNRYFLNEFPTYNAVVAIFYKWLGVNPTIARAVSLVISLIGLLFLYLLARKLFGIKISAVASFFYAINPFNIFYSTAVMPDPLFIASSIAALYFTLAWVESKKAIFAIATTLVFALAILTKPYALFLALPIAYWVLINWRKDTFKNWQVYLVAIGSTAPFLLWRYHLAQHPEGSFASSWLFNQGNIRFTGAFFRWLIFERASKVIFATGGFILFVFGLLKSYQDKKSSFIFVWLISVVVYLTIFAKGNVNHDYYQLPILPIGSVLMAMGFWGIVDSAKKPLVKFLNLSVAISLVLIFVAFGWYEVRGFFNINNPAIVDAGIAADEILPKEAKVVAPYGGDPAFLYQTNRPGLPIVDRPLTTLVDDGFLYFVTVDTQDEGVKRLIEKCRVLKQTESFAILELSKECLS